VIAWTSTPVTEAIQGLRGLLESPAWQACQHAPVIRAALRQHLDDPDQVNRMLATQALHLIEPDAEQRLQLIRQQLLAEIHPFIRAILFSQLGPLIPKHAAAIDGVVAELAAKGHWPLAPPTPAAVPPAADAQNAAEEDADDDLSKRELLQVTAQLLLLLAIRHEQPTAAGVVHRWFTNPLDDPEAFQQGVFELRDMGMLAIEQEGSPVAVKAFDLLRQATDQLVAAVEAQLSAAERDTDALKSALRMANAIVDQLYSASGALDARQATASPGLEQAEPRSHASAAFFTLAMPLLERMTQVHQPGITHQLIETLAHLAEHDPKRVLLAVHRSVPPGQLYEYEPLAVELILNLIQRYLADYRHLVTRDEESLTALRQVLEVFVRAGWPSAIGLAYQLPEAFR
jgi:hypothetical protein